ncbi:MAG: DISARM system SNF2-like helicase DrmD [Myxococcales bacterium]|nr:DISARM system SNF2-like helicase DrmD [Myxococcales bacterium]
MVQPPKTASLLDALTKDRLVELGRVFDVALTKKVTKEQQIATLLGTSALDFERALGFLRRDELRAACRAHGLTDEGRARQLLADRLRGARGEQRKTTGFVPVKRRPRFVPEPGDIVQVRHRQWLVEAVVPPPAPPEPGGIEHNTLVKLVCLDDDNQGRGLSVLWELELGARILQPESEGLGAVQRIDPPRFFAAYLHALKWHSVSATDRRLFQSPFRAGIKLMNHQLTPLMKALDLPRANLFIADDVGLGKTIEAGLVLSELLLRQRVETVLIVCPASIVLQWRDEMERRFGLHFEVYNRAFIARRRQERGFGVNPWTTHNRFIISYPLLRRPEYRDPLLAHIGDRLAKSLLILDEAHSAAPASNHEDAKYATDSRVTRVVRDVAPRFENRLFLSATPHNGHSNSFSTLLEILDPQRFTRGVPVEDASQLRPVMVRRLKSDLLALDVKEFPERQVLQIDLAHRDGVWTAQTERSDEQPRVLGEAESAHELELARLLGEYSSIAAPKRGRARLVFINLQKRLLSSVEAFHRTLTLHARNVSFDDAPVEPSPQGALALEEDDDEYGVDDEQADAIATDAIASASRELAPDARAKQLLEQMLRLAAQHRGSADAKALALLDWIRQNQCATARLGGANPDADGSWSDRRVIIFTEYGDTKRYLAQLLRNAIDGSQLADQRIMQFHGGMSDEQREHVQRAFNSPPELHPVRILVATDAAREGVNLQGHCADLFHYDIPWNPARMEQRNGRIDRTLQPEATVRCMYFFYPQRAEDPVLRKVVDKVEVIRRELGSLGEVVFERLGELLELGIDAKTAEAIDAADQLGLFGEVAKQELEAPSRQSETLAREIERAGEILNGSRELVEFDASLLRDAVDVGLELCGTPPLSELGGGVYQLPEMPDSWQPTLDALRPPRARDESFWDWRKRPPMPVVFTPPARINAQLSHLHLQHPLVRRLMSRFLSQGFSAHDLSRVTIVRNSHDSLVRVIAFGRLSLFGRGATRLHDTLISVAARWLDAGGAGHLAPFGEAADRKALEQLEQILRESPTLEGVSEAVQKKIAGRAADDFARLWKAIDAEADEERVRASQELEQRGIEEAAALKDILERQQRAIEAATRGQARQLTFGESEIERAQQRQLERDLEHMQQRLAQIGGELEREPEQLRTLYEVVLSRLEPVGMVYLWPTTRG